MKQTTKGALLSALILPGAGHLALRSKARGWILISLSVACLVYIFALLIPIVTGIVSEITRGGTSVDPADLNRMVKGRLMGGGASAAGYAVWALIVIWVVALIDVIRLGRKRDKTAVSR